MNSIGNTIAVKIHDEEIMCIVIKNLDNGMIRVYPANGAPDDYFTVKKFSGYEPISN